MRTIRYNLNRSLVLVSLALTTTSFGAAPAYQSKFYAVGLSPARPAFTCFAVDSLGQGKVGHNPVLAEFPATATPGLELQGRFTYLINGKPSWRITCDERSLTLRLHPMLAGYAAGEFQGFGVNGMSRDWRDWKGGCHGYEGLLVDNYLPLLAVLDDVKAANQQERTHKP
jgi:hypothetical protein